MKDETLDQSRPPTPRAMAAVALGRAIWNEMRVAHAAVVEFGYSEKEAFSLVPFIVNPVLSFIYKRELSKEKAKKYDELLAHVKRRMKECERESKR